MTVRLFVQRLVRNGALLTVEGDLTAWRALGAQIGDTLVVRETGSSTKPVSIVRIEPATVEVSGPELSGMLELERIEENPSRLGVLVTVTKTSRERDLADARAREIEEGRLARLDLFLRGYFHG